MHIVLAAAPAASAGCFLTSDCYDEKTVTYRVAEPPPMQLEMLVRACEADAKECFQLCQKVFQDDHPYLGISDCTVKHDATGHDLKINYEVATGASGCPVEGRRPPGLQRCLPRRRTLAGAQLARAAHFEAASVYAFVGLARELSRHGAPDRLIDAARRAALDEVRHAKLVGELARAHGAEPAAAVVAPRFATRRSLESIAIENAMEGEVGETWAALVAYWQAQHAPTAELRAAYAQIADDELRHAELAREVAAWAETQLSGPARKRVRRARQTAVTRLARGVRRGAPRALTEELGIPAPAQMQQLFADARSQLWT